MDEFNLSKESFDVLKGVDLSELGNHVILLEENNSFETDELGELLDLLNYEITLKGMKDHQQRVNEYGKKLYKLYDEIIAQCEEE